MARDFGNSYKKSTVVAFKKSSQALTNTIGGIDRTDYLRFKLFTRSSFQATLSKLQANADLALLNQAGKVIIRSRNKGKKSETIATILDAGTYFLKITPSRGSNKTNYRLLLSKNATPILTANTPLSLSKGTPVIFNGTQLKVTDAEQNTSQLVYTLTRLPEAGLLLLNGTRLNTGASFTQADIDAGRLIYRSFGKSQRLTSNTVDDLFPQISGFNVVWEGEGGSDGGTDQEIFLFNGSTVTQLTTNNTYERLATIVGSTAAWDGSGDIFFFNGSTTVPLTSSNDLRESIPQISGSNVVWSGGVLGSESSTEVFFFNGSTVTQLTNNSTADYSPRISGSNVVWYGTGGTDGGTDYEIFFFNGSTVTQLTTNTTDDLLPKISGPNVVWYGTGGTDGGTDYEIFFSNGSQVTQLTTNNTDDIYPEISGSNVVWSGRGGTDGGADYEVFFFNGSQVTQLTTNNTSDFLPQISGSIAAWEGEGGTDGGIDTEIFFFDGSTVTQLTNNNFEEENPQVSGFNLAWMGIDNSSASREVYFGNVATSDSFSFMIADGAGGLTDGTFNLNLI